MPNLNRQITLVSKLAGVPKETDFRVVEAPVPNAGAGEVLVHALYLSVDPYVHSRPSTAISPVKGAQPGDVVAGEAVGRVVASNDPRLTKDDVVEGTLGWQEYAVAHAKALRKIDPAVAPISTSLYALGLPGLTAYFGLLDICRPQPGETVVVSAAAGAVGSLAGQIARIKRCRAVGIAGGDDKVSFITRELGFEAGFNYTASSDYVASLRDLCPNGIDVYFDNAGGPIADAVMRLINTRARIAICGPMSHYSADQPEAGPHWLGQIVAKQAKVEGFQVHQFADRFEEGLRQLTQWLREKRLRYREDIVEGIENAPKAFIGMLEGRNIGQQLVKVAA